MVRVRSRRGLLLPLALVLLAIALLFASTRVFVSRQQLDAVVRLSDRERAYQLAASALGVGIRQADRLFAHLNDPDPKTFPKRENLPASVKTLATAVLDTKGALAPGRTQAELASPTLDQLRQVADGGDLGVTFTLTAAKPLFTETGGPGIVVDPRETTRLLTLESRAEAGKSRTKIVAFKEVRTVNITPPVVGKFVLFVRRQGGFDPASVRDSLHKEKVDSFPAAVRCGEKVAAASLAPESAGALIDKQGWVFLGGDKPWRLPLARGGGLPQYEAAGLVGALYRYEMEPGSLFATRGDLGYYAKQVALHVELATDEWSGALAQKGLDLVARSCPLNLLGTADWPSPTLVCGSVYRRWALIQGLENRAAGTYAPLPCLDAAGFASGTWPGRASPSTVDAIRQNFGGDYAAYARRMSDIVEEPYNAGNASFVLPAAREPAVWASGSRAEGPGSKMDGLPERSDGEPGRQMVSEPGRPAFGIALPASKKLSIDGRMAALDQVAHGSSYALEDDEGRRVFTGGSLDAMPDLDFLTQKAGRHFESTAELFLECGDRSGGLVISGVVQVEGELVIDRPVTVRRGGGGIVLAGRSVRIRRGIAAEDGEPLTLVSLRGDLQVETAEPVAAGLIALAGTVRLGAAFDIRGLLAAGELALDRSPAQTVRRIAYNPFLDPTDASNYRRNARVMTQPRWRSYVP